MKVENLSAESWRASNVSGIALANRWRDSSGVVVPSTVAVQLCLRSFAGSSIDLEIVVTAPMKPGDWTLELDMVEEGITWFSDRGSSLTGCASVCNGRRASGISFSEKKPRLRQKLERPRHHEYFDTDTFLSESGRSDRKAGGYLNAHLHLDRAGTLDDEYLGGIGYQVFENSHVSLHRKHNMISDIHQGPAYESKDLHQRVNAYLDMMVAVGTVRADTLVDVTADGIGLIGFKSAAENQARARQRHRDAALGPIRRWDSPMPNRSVGKLLLEGAEQADFIGSLPEADDTKEYPENIGFLEHCRRVLELSKRFEQDGPRSCRPAQRAERIWNRAAH